MSDLSPYAHPDPVKQRAGESVLRALGAAPGDVPVGATRTLELAHTWAISWVAAYPTLRGRGWLGERALRRDERWRVPVIWLASRSTHRPDLVVLIDDRPLAIEVKLTPKAPRGLRAILHGYENVIARGAFSRVGYVVNDAAVREDSNL